MLFKYKAKNKNGEFLSGLVDATSDKQAAVLLRGQGLFIISLIGQEPSIFSQLTIKFSRVSFNDIVTFTQQLSTMLTAGLTLTDSLNILKLQATNPAFGKVVSGMLKEIEGGLSFSKALGKYPEHFSAIYISLVQAGEASGKLQEVFARLASNLEKQREFRTKTKGALIYPAIILIGMIVVVFIMMTVVVPRLTDLYKDFGTELPPTTQLLIAVSEFFVRFWWLLIIMLWGGFVAWRSWKKTPIGARMWDRFILDLPIWGNLKKQLVLTEFSRTLGILAGSGIPILQSLEIVGGAVDSVTYQNDLKEVAKQVEKGYPLGIPISQNPDFPPILGQMISVGEETGKLDETLLKISTFFEAEAEQGIKTLTTAMEPLIMVVLGVGVGFIVISILMPIYNLTNQF
ncbi:type II secretion system F family protein [Candidatus Gottesmanbacteria bacterium]|nr:type II secretion system F family protein [Candidatus Gottesmanbacteria bacterium]